MTMDIDQPIRPETQRMLWMLAMCDVRFSTFCDLKPANQLALAAVFGLDVDGVAIALEQLTIAFRAKVEQLKQLSEAHLRNAH
jgi:hypothetical protein